MDKNNKCAGIIFNIQKFTLHDGPGIRTMVFFKGCPLRCQWCSNPESQGGAPEVAFNSGKCIGFDECGLCVKECGQGAVCRDEGQKISIIRNLCDNCGACARVCPSKAMFVFGENMTGENILKKVEEDSAFYARSGGGLTLSGGEPLAQHEFAGSLLKKAKLSGIDTAIETCGLAEWENMQNVLQYVDTIFYDIKCIDAGKHLKYTGGDNKTILENFRKTAARFPQKNIVARTPVIPGFNNNHKDIQDIKDYLRDFKNIKRQLLAYHNFGEIKYGYLGKEYFMKNVKKITNDEIKELNRQFLDLD